MSESGKVSLPMTPEQIEAYKAYSQINRGLPPEMAIELLAALEESQQHNVEAITFEKFVEYGKNNGGNIVNGMPWSFNYKGHAVTHENNERYLIATLEGSMDFTPNDVLITGVNGEIYTCRVDGLNDQLAEAQQTIKELQEANRSACESRDMAYRSRDEAIVTSNQHYKHAFFLNEGLIEAQQTIAQQGEIIHGIDRDLTKLRLALIAIAGMDVIGSSAISMKSIAQEALREGAKES